MRLNVKTSKHLGVHCTWEDVATFEKLLLLEIGAGKLNLHELSIKASHAYVV